MGKFTTEIDGLYYDKVRISGFWPEILKIQHRINPETNYAEKRYLISVHLAGGQQLKTQEISALEHIDYFSLWPECKDALMKSRERKMLYLYLQEQVDSVPCENIYVLNHLGMYQHGYLFGKNAFIAFNPKEAVSCLEDSTLPCFPYIEEDQVSLITYCKRLILLKPDITQVLFSISIFSVLKPLFVCAGYYSDFFITLYGPSGSMKTTLAELFFVQTPEQKINFIDYSKKQFETMLRTYTGHSIVIDDYHSVAGTYQKQNFQNKLDIIARASSQPNSALSIITGEFLDGIFSIQDRMIQIFIDGPVKNTAELTLLQEKSYLFSTILFRFAQKVFLDRDHVIQRIQAEFQEFSYGCTSSMYFRIQRNVLFLKWSMELFKEYFDVRTQEEFDISNALQKLQRRQESMLERLQLLERGDWIVIFYNMITSGFLTADLSLKIFFRRFLFVTYNDCIYITSHVLKNAPDTFKKRVNIKLLIVAGRREVTKRRRIICTCY